MFSGVLLPEYPCKYPTDSSATARPPALFGLKKPWYNEGKARGHIGWNTVRRHPAEPSQPVQRFLKFHKLSYYSPCCKRKLRRLSLTHFALHCCLNKTQHGCDREAWPIVVGQRAPATTRARKLGVLKIPKTAPAMNSEMQGQKFKRAVPLINQKPSNGSWCRRGWFVRSICASEKVSQCEGGKLTGFDRVSSSIRKLQHSPGGAVCAISFAFILGSSTVVVTSLNHQPEVNAMQAKRIPRQRRPRVRPPNCN